MTVTLKPFDPSKYLDDEVSIAAFLKESAGFGDAHTMLGAIGHVARARNMTMLAKAAGITREGLYKALGPDGNPSLDTVMRVVRAMGYRMDLVQAPAPAVSKPMARIVGARQTRSAARKPAASKAPEKRAAKPRA